MMEKVISLIRRDSADSQFETLLRPHLHHLYQVAFRFVGNAADAEDLVQDVLVKLYPKRRQLADIETLRPWLTRVLYRMFIDQRRKMNRSPLSLVKGGVDEQGTSVLDRLHSPEPDPADQVDRAITRKRLQKAINSLNHDQQSLCLLHDVEGYTLQELEGILETPIGTLKSRLHRARARLRVLLAS